jgi:elongation factor P
VTEYHHVKPGKGSAFVRVKLKNVKTDAAVERTFKTADKLEDIGLEERELEYLYKAGDTYHFMDHTTYEQISIIHDDLGGVEGFLLENLEVTGLVHSNKVLKIILPTFITTKITQTEPGVRGDSSRAGTKPAKIETGTTILVPLFINVDDWIKIDTRTSQYVERVQK